MECLATSERGNSQLLEYAAGRLLGRKAHEVAFHLRSCAKCERFVREQSALWDALDCWDAAPVSMTFNRDLYARIDRSHSASWLGTAARKFNAMVARPAFSLAALSLAVLAGFYMNRPQLPVRGAAAVEVAPAVTPTDAEQLSKALDDMKLLHQFDLVKDEAANASRGM